MYYKSMHDSCDDPMYGEYSSHQYLYFCCISTEWYCSILPRCAQYKYRYCTRYELLLAAVPVFQYIQYILHSTSTVLIRFRRALDTSFKTPRLQLESLFPLLTPARSNRELDDYKALHQDKSAPKGSMLVD
jgi:hypothetical protein